ncbi:MAG: hypothetical protein LBK69_03860 [Syntrophomonadaceae bacterium]|jgi:hypothetical protein|nr:hypothetical protein [Syntrophomonadaceae bacterium]
MSNDKDKIKDLNKEELAKIHKRVIEITQSHINNLNLSGFHGRSISHADRALKVKVIGRTGNTLKVAVYLAWGERTITGELVNVDPITEINPPPPLAIYPLVGAVGFLIPIIVEIDIPEGKTEDDITVIDVLIKLLHMVVTEDNVDYTISDVLTDSIHKFFEALVITYDGEEGTVSVRYPDSLSEVHDDDFPFNGYFDFQYDGEGNLTGGKYEFYGPMIFRGKPVAGTEPGQYVPYIAPPDHGDEDSSWHGPGYFKKAPGEYPVPWLPTEDIEGDDVYYMTVCFERMELEFEIHREVNENGVVVSKHTITFHNRVKPTKAS